MLFDEVEFTELQRDAAEELVATYREEGQKNLPPPPEPSPPAQKKFKEGRDDRGGRSRLFRVILTRQFSGEKSQDIVVTAVYASLSSMCKN